MWGGVGATHVPPGGGGLPPAGWGARGARDPGFLSVPGSRMSMEEGARTAIAGRHTRGQRGGQGWEWEWGAGPARALGTPAWSRGRLVLAASSAVGGCTEVQEGARAAPGLGLWPCDPACRWGMRVGGHSKCPE